MSRSVSALALLLSLAGAAGSQTPSQLVTPEIRRVGDKLACQCGHCKNTVASCQMIGCGFATPAREKIAAAQKAGQTDEAIVDSFVKDMGLVALAVPPAEGFNLLGWIMPFIGIALGIVAIGLYWKRFHPVGSGAVTEPPLDERYRKRIEAEMADLD
jgi:cytochrome c-type biogenesis protein CcmH/NrfF